MKRNKGISLIVLVITIIIMIVLAGAIILSLNNAGIIERANEAVEKTDINQVQILAELKWSEAYLREEKELWQLKKAVRDGLTQEGINIDEYDIEITTKGTTVKVKENTEVVSEEKTGADGQFRYVKLANEDIQITRYIGQATSVEIPGEYTGEDGIKYNVYAVGNIDVDMHAQGKIYNIFGETNSTSNDTITSIIIGEGIKEIKPAAFSGCKGLTGQLILPSTLKSIGGGAFNGCTGLTGDLIIPEGVTTIAALCFYNCSGLDGVLTLPSTLEIIELHAFNSCKGLTGALIIPEGITTIGRTAFQNCEGFTSLTLPNTLEIIEPYAFNDCSGLKGDLILPARVNNIGEYAFKNCKGLTGTITTNGIIVAANAFQGCSNLTVVKE